MIVLVNLTLKLALGMTSNAGIARALGHLLCSCNSGLGLRCSRCRVVEAGGAWQILYRVFGFSLFFVLRTLPARDPSLLLKLSGSGNIDSSSLDGDGARSASSEAVALPGRREEKKDNRLAGGAFVSSIDLLLSSLPNGFSMLITFVGRLGVHRASVLGWRSLTFADSVSVSAIAVNNRRNVRVLQEIRHEATCGVRQ